MSRFSSTIIRSLFSFSLRYTVAKWFLLPLRYKPLNSKNSREHSNKFGPIRSFLKENQIFVRQVLSLFRDIIRTREHAMNKEKRSRLAHRRRASREHRTNLSSIHIVSNVHLHVRNTVCDFRSTIVLHTVDTILRESAFASSTRHI